jgi:hypothetical protein
MSLRSTVSLSTKSHAIGVPALTALVTTCPSPSGVLGAEGGSQQQGPVR